MSDYRLELINSQTKLSALAAQLATLSVISLDIETVEWWDKYRERIALIQIAFRTPERGIKVAIIDALAKEINIEGLRALFESKELIKVIHNAAFDAGKVFRHYKFRVAPIFDTMIAARRNGERKYSLAAQTAAHLGFELDKGFQRSDWSRRPLDLKQIDYAARDAYATLLLYEHQVSRNLTSHYRLKPPASSAVQGRFELIEPEERQTLPPAEESKPDPDAELLRETLPEGQELAAEAQAVLGIIVKLPDRYSPARLAVSVGLGRVGLVGWIVDNALGRDADFEEETAMLVISDLIERGLIRVNEFQNLEATAQGIENLES